MKNYGVILKPRRATDFRFGGISPIPQEVLQGDGQWDECLPAYEPQSDPKFDTMACVTFSALNCLETLKIAKYQTETNYSDRFIAKLSGTTQEGNDPSTVGNTIRGMGNVLESDWPFTQDMDWNTFYAEVPIQIAQKGQDFLQNWDVFYEYVWDTPESLMEALKYAPLQVLIHAYGTFVNGIYQRTTDSANHAVMLYGYEFGNFWKIYDHYDNKFKKLAWDTMFHGAVKYHLSNKSSKPPMSLPENSLQQLVEAPGGFALHIKGELYIDDVSLLLASWAARNGVNGTFERGPVGTLTLEQWNSFPHKNLKGQPL